MYDEVTTLEVGLFLYASCAGADYGRIVGMGKDSNGTPTIDIEVFDPQDVISFDWDMNSDEPPPLTRLELPPGTTVILRDVQYEQQSDPTRIVCKTPGDNCYRCTKLFSLNKRSERIK